MGKEYEAKILNINPYQARQKLIEIGGKLDHTFIMFKRAVFKHYDPSIKGFSRVRDEGKKITLTSKIYKDEKFPEEYEITIGESFDTGINFMKSLGLKQKAFQESYREKWSHPLAHEITFDILPGIPIYMEIDCTSEKNLNKLVNLLNVNKGFQRYGAFDKTYWEYYGIEPDILNDSTPSLSFDNISNEITIKKNNNLLKIISEIYKQLKNYSKTNSIDKFVQDYSKIYDKIVLNSIKPTTQIVKKISRKSSNKSIKKSSKKSIKKSSKKSTKK